MLTSDQACALSIYDVGWIEGWQAFPPEFRGREVRSETLARYADAYARGYNDGVTQLVRSGYDYADLERMRTEAFAGESRRLHKLNHEDV